MPRRKPRIQKEFIWRGQGYDCKWDFTSNTKLTFILLAFILLISVCLVVEMSFEDWRCYTAVTGEPVVEDQFKHKKARDISYV